jgi:cell wall assembly regulator SMI1
MGLEELHDYFIQVIWFPMPEDRTKEFLVESVAFFLIIAAFRKSNGTESLTR